MNEPLNIDIYSDVVCPWCYVGKRRLSAPFLSFRPYQRRSRGGRFS